MERILLIGGGGHCKVVIELIKLQCQFEIVGICDPKPGHVLNVPVVGNDDRLPDIFASGVRNAFISLGAICHPEKRKEIAENLLNIGYKLPNLIHPRAYIAPSVKMGGGNFIGVNAIVNTDASLQDCCIVNSGAIIEHDCHLGSYVHVAPGAKICGGVEVGDLSHIGPNATILQDRKISRGVVIGASSLVTADIDLSNITGYGTPFKKVRFNG